MRRLLAMICCLVFATTIVARGAGMSSCPDGASCCAAMPEPVTAKADDCCAKEETPKSHPAHSAAMGEMPCCASIIWTPLAALASVDFDAPARDHVALPTSSKPAAPHEPAIPPPRVAVG